MCMKQYLVLLLLLASCQAVIEPSQTNVDLETFTDVEQLKSFLGQSGSTNDGMFLARAGVAEMATDAASSAPPGLDTSKTNVQVQGIDEADILKVEGEFVYTITDNTVFVLHAYPGEDAQVLSRTAIEDSPVGLFVQDNTLVVITSSWNYYGRGDIMSDRMMIWPGPQSQTTRVHLFRINSDKSLSEQDSFSFEGSYVDARLKDGVAYVVVNSAVSQDHPLPSIMRNGVEETFPINRIAYYPSPYDSPQLTSVHAITLNSRALESQGVLTEYANTVYMSHEALYLASSVYVNEWRIREEQVIVVVSSEVSSDDRALLRRIDMVDSDILSAGEKRQKKLSVLYNHIALLSSAQQRTLEDEIEQATQEELDKHTYRDYTRISKVSLDSLTVTASQEIVGTVNNQFSLDEHNGVLRVATTTQAIWQQGKSSRDSENHVFTLDASLRVLDHLDGIAPTEQIFSARYVGDRLYLVTFEIIDPFFVIDLSQPENIRILGELKIEGFSRYLHPYDEHTIIGFGRDANSRGVQQGLKISLFDVSDVSQPREIASWTGDERSASSAAEYEHKAFLFDKERNLLVIPVYSYDWRQGSESYNGALVFFISKDEVTLRGLIDHASGREWGMGVERSFYIEELLYTKSPGLIRINNLDSLASVKNITLTPVSRTDIPVY